MFSVFSNDTRRARWQVKGKLSWGKVKTSPTVHPSILGTSSGKQLNISGSCRTKRLHCCFSFDFPPTTRTTYLHYSTFKITSNQIALQFESTMESPVSSLCSKLAFCSACRPDGSPLLSTRATRRTGVSPPIHRHVSGKRDGSERSPRRRHPHCQGGKLSRPCASRTFATAAAVSDVYVPTLCC